MFSPCPEACIFFTFGANKEMTNLEGFSLRGVLLEDLGVGPGTVPEPN